MRLRKPNPEETLRHPELMQIERRNDQLWWLAILIIVLLTLTITAMDTYPIFRQGPAQKLGAGQLNGITIRLSLIVSTFLICTYFRECTRTLLRMNRKLITDLQAERAAMERKNVELWRLKQLSDVLMSRYDISSALDIALQMATEVIGADTASIMLLDDSGEHLRIVAARGIPDEVIKEARIKVGEGLAGLVAKEGESLILNSDELDDRLKPLAHRQDKVSSAIISPIQIDGHVRGVINVTNRRDGGKYSNNDLNTVATLAQQASMVIQKIELHEHLQNQVVKLQTALDQLSQTQSELVQAEKLASIGQLAGGIAHEINNPLHVMLGRAELIISSLSEDAPQRRDARILYKQVERVAGIVRNLLSFARRGGTDDFRTTNVNEVVEQTLELVERQMVTDNVEVRRKQMADLPEIWGNPRELQQVFLNIILNAYQVLKSSGGWLQIVTQVSGDNVEIIFSDNGPGIPDEHVPHVFEPFYTTKQEGEGVGLGLSVSYGIVQTHNGNIELKTKVGEGTSFKLTFPLPREAKAA